MPSPSSPDRVLFLPGLKENDNVQFAGYAPITGAAYPKTRTGKEESLFYWFVGSQDYANRPTIIWSNGGPGSSSFWGFFLENGPYEIVSASTPSLAVREQGWNHFANYLMFEQPLSVMLSFDASSEDLPANVHEGTQQYYQALLNFLQLHPEIAQNPIILAGESYAGTYLPLLAQAIVDGNARGMSPQIDLKAVTLLDAWVDPYVQMSQDTLYAYTHGMISAREKQHLDAHYLHNYPSVNQAIQQVCGLYMTNIAQLADPPFEPIIHYLNRPDVREAIHVPSTKELTTSWSLDISNNYQLGVNDSCINVIETLLSQQIQIVVVSGLNDAKDCNFLGTAKWLESLNGTAAHDFHEAQTKQWRSEPNSPVLGYIQNGGLLSWVKVLNAGHMAARDQPQIIHLLQKLIGF